MDDEEVDDEGVDDQRYAQLQDDVYALLDDLAGLDEADVRALAGLWAQEDQTARERGWRIARRALDRLGLHELLADAREAVRRWASPTRADYPGLQVEVGLPNAHLEPRRAAAPAVLDAIVGLLAEDELADDEYEALSRPWATIAGGEAEGAAR